MTEKAPKSKQASAVVQTFCSISCLMNRYAPKLQDLPTHTLFSSHTAGLTNHIKLSEKCQQVSYCVCLCVCNLWGEKSLNTLSLLSFFPLSLVTLAREETDVRVCVQASGRVMRLKTFIRINNRDTYAPEGFGPLPSLSFHFSLSSLHLTDLQTSSPLTFYAIQHGRNQIDLLQLHV